jgi:UDP-galactopyranose mutase
MSPSPVAAGLALGRPPAAEPDAEPPDLLVFSHLGWDFVFQRPQQLLSRLAHRHRVLFVEEPLYEAGPPRLERVRPTPNVEVLRLRAPLAAAGFHDATLALLGPLLTGHLHDQGVNDYVAWLYTPLALPLLRGLRPRAVVYDCIEDSSLPEAAASPRLQHEQQLLLAADLVLTGGLALYEGKRRLHGNVHCLPNAVDAAHFAPDATDPGLPALQAAARLQGEIASPRLGYFGAIDDRLNLGLLARLADAHADWQIVLVGPLIRIDPAALPRRPNLHWLGPQPYELLPQLVAGWDLCLLPYALNEATRCLCPNQTLEYLAAEKPVIATPLHDVVALHGEAVEIARGNEDFVAACERVLAEPPRARQRRLAAMSEAVSQSSWDRTAETVEQLLEQALRGRPASAPGASAPAPMPTAAERALERFSPL